MTKAYRRKTGVWSSSRKVLAKPYELRVAQELQSMLTEELAVLPRQPSDVIKPFRIGINDALMALRKPDITPSALGIAIQKYTRSTGYLLALSIDDSLRYNLDGSDAGTVSDKDRLAARDAFHQSLAKRERRKAERKNEPRRHCRHARRLSRCRLKTPTGQGAKY